MKKLIYILFLFLSLFPLAKAFATFQKLDGLIYNGDTLEIVAKPLEQLSNIKELRPILFGDKKGCWSSACLIGYKALWIIIDDTLYLEGIFECCYKYGDGRRADLTKLFGSKCKNGLVKADWYSGPMISPQGERLYYNRSTYELIHETEIVFRIKKGVLIGTETNDNSKVRRTEYGYNENLLMNYIYTNIRWNSLPKLKNKGVEVTVKFSANEDGVIDSANVIKGYSDIFNKEAIRVVKAIPEWDVSFRHGKFVRLSKELSIIFSEANRKRYNQ